MVAVASVVVVPTVWRVRQSGKSNDGSLDPRSAETVPSDEVGRVVISLKPTTAPYCDNGGDNAAGDDSDEDLGMAVAAAVKSCTKSLIFGVLFSIR